jgi:hypothetical protein
MGNNTALAFDQIKLICSLDSSKGDKKYKQLHANYKKFSTENLNLIEQNKTDFSNSFDAKKLNTLSNVYKNCSPIGTNCTVKENKKSTSSGYSSESSVSSDHAYLDSTSFFSLNELNASNEKLSKLVNDQDNYTDTIQYDSFSGKSRTIAKIKKSTSKLKANMMNNFYANSSDSSLASVESSFTNKKSKYSMTVKKSEQHNFKYDDFVYGQLVRKESIQDLISDCDVSSEKISNQIVDEPICGIAYKIVERKRAADKERDEMIIRHPALISKSCRTIPKLNYNSTSTNVKLECPSNEDVNLLKMPNKCTKYKKNQNKYPYNIRLQEQTFNSTELVYENLEKLPESLRFPSHNGLENRAKQTPELCETNSRAKNFSMQKACSNATIYSKCFSKKTQKKSSSPPPPIFISPIGLLPPPPTKFNRLNYTSINSISEKQSYDHLNFLTNRND